MERPTEWLVGYLPHGKPIPPGHVFSTLAHTHHGRHVAGIIAKEVKNGAR